MSELESEAATPAPEHVKELTRGQTIGRYVVIGLVGRGGMGEVYAAYDPELERKVAVKLVRARGRPTVEGRLRLLREAQAIAQLSHPNVVVVYDVGTFRESVFIAMEFLDGTTGTYWLHAEERSWREILSVFIAAGRGLAAAHQAGLVHRDFKPDNIMLTRDGQVRVMDFGLARTAGGPEESTPTPPRELPALLQPPAEDAGDDGLLATRAVASGSHPADGRTASARFLSTKLTQTGAQTGTPAYMAPEQFARTRVDARTDQFSFCVALYEALYGERPFAGTDLASLMANVTTGNVRSAPAGSRVPGWVRRILLQGLQVYPERRFSSMGALLGALGSDPSARRRNNLLFGGIAAAALALVVTAHHLGGRASNEGMCAGGVARLAGIWEPSPTSPRRLAIRHAMLSTGVPDAARALAGAERYLDRYAAEWTRLYRETCEATHVRGEQSAEVLDLRMSCLRERLGALRALSDLLATAHSSMVGNAVQAAGALPSLQRCSDVASLRAIIPPPDDPKKRRQVEILRGELARFTALKDAGQCDLASRKSIELIAAVRQTGYMPLVAQTLDMAAMLGNACADPVTSVDRARESYYAAIESHDDHTAAEAATTLGALAANRLAQPRAARDWVGIGWATLRRIGGDATLEANLCEADASTLDVEGKRTEALASYKRALALRMERLGPEHPHTLASRMNLGNQLVAAGALAEGLDLTTQALNGFEKVLGAHDAWVAIASSNRCEALNRLRRYGEARDACQRAVDIWRGTKTDPFLLAYGLAGLGLAYLGQGEPARARAPLEEAHRIRLEKNADAEHLGEVRFGLARALWPEGEQRMRAVALARQAQSDYGSLAGHDVERSEIDRWLADHR